MCLFLINKVKRNFQVTIPNLFSKFLSSFFPPYSLPPSISNLFHTPPRERFHSKVEWFKNEIRCFEKPGNKYNRVIILSRWRNIIISSTILILQAWLLFFLVQYFVVSFRFILVYQNRDEWLRNNNIRNNL